MNSQPQTFIYTALACEAKPLIRHFRLKKENRKLPFAVYGNGSLYLVVTGVGKTAMAAGLAYSQALYSGTECPVLINVGIAGHRTATISTPFLADKITDADTGKNYYPVPAFPFPCASAPVITAVTPQTDYRHESLCDMEASAFYETAVKFSTGELIQCLKIVSDNQATPAEHLDDKQAIALVERRLGVLETLLDAMKELSQCLDVGTEEELYPHLIGQWRFTVSQQNRLRHLLWRWRVLTDNRPLSLNEAEIGSAHALLHWLEQRIGEVDVEL